MNEEQQNNQLNNPIEQEQVVPTPVPPPIPPIPPISNKEIPSIPKSHSNKTTIFLIIILILLIGVGGSFWLSSNKVDTEPNPVACTDDAKQCPDGSFVGREGPSCEFRACPVVQDETANSDATVGASWQTYRNEEFEIMYPENFSINSDTNKVTINHSVSYTHNDACEFRDGSNFLLDKVIDFNATLQVFNKDIESTVRANYFSPDDIIENGQFKLSSGFVDAYSVGILDGYRHTIGAEGCGVNTYYFSLDNSNTLMVTQKFSPERTPLILDYKKYLDLPGIISPEEEDKMFDQILSTFKFIDQETDKSIVTFQQCVDAGNAVMESFPEQCRTQDGLLFVNWSGAGQVCAQVIAPARNPQTGEVREFPTPCDVPSNWEQI
jgi:hypothetical protein